MDGDGYGEANSLSSHYCDRDLKRMSAVSQKGVHFQADNTCRVCLISDFETFFLLMTKTFRVSYFRLT
jgi:hypothetical protein